MVLVKEVEMMAEEVAEEKKVVEGKVDRCPPDFLWKWVVEPV